ncbi:MAG: FG-GAP-like repeat-containing protein [Phycisphaerae bacterium]
MTRRPRFVLGALCLLSFSAIANAQWAQFLNQTATRVNALPGVSTADPEEKDYAWGDFDHDGDTDLVCVRKIPFTLEGGKINVLFMNENGVLVDRTSIYATASDVGGDQGFNTPTNDRDVVAVDVNNDGWLDIVTATTLSDGLPKHIGHPRVYINLKDNPPGSGVWQGFRFENARIPQLLSVTGAVANPRFCSVAAGDVTGDGYADLYFGDYDGSEIAQSPAENPANDMDNKLLINMGAANPGYFVDESVLRMGTQFSYAGVGIRAFTYTTFGAASIIADMNGDGIMDVVKQTALVPPQHVAVMRNPPGNVGFFDNYNIVYSNSPYFVSAADLNNDNRLDLIITDDNADTYLLNTGNNPQGSPNFTALTFSFAAGGDDGFGSQSIAADLNNDGFKDVLIADIDVDGFGCGRRTHIYHNLANPPNVTLREESPSIIPTNMLTGTHNIAVFDLNGDGWNDVILGRCNSMEVWINNPPVSVSYSYPSGRLSEVPPNQAGPFQVRMTPVNGTLNPSTATLYWRLSSGGAFTPVALSQVDATLFDASLPATACGSTIQYYLSVQLAGGATFTDPAAAPTTFYTTFVATGHTISLQDFEVDGNGWTVSQDPAVTSGGWVRVDPIGTISGADQAQPEDDVDNPGTMCFVTGQGAPGGAAGAADIDGGGVNLVSPAIDLTGTDARISYYRWFYGGSGDTFEVAVSNNDGGSWTVVESLAASANIWTQNSFVVSTYFPGQALSANVRVRFRCTDGGTGTVCEGGMDDFNVDKIVCFVPTCACFGDMDASGTRNGDDIYRFVQCLLVGGACDCADFAAPPGPDANDIAPFISVLLTDSACPPP